MQHAVPIAQLPRRSAPAQPRHAGAEAQAGAGATWSARVGLAITTILVVTAWAVALSAGGAHGDAGHGPAIPSWAHGAAYAAAGAHDVAHHADGGAAAQPHAGEQGHPAGMEHLH